MTYRRHWLVRFLQPILVGVTVFIAAAVVGMLLAGAVPPPRPATPGDTVSASRVTSEPAATPDEEQRTFARSLVASGAAGLVLSITGMVMVARRRRFW